MTQSDMHRRMKARNIALAAAILAFVLLFFAITIVKLGQAVPS